MGLILSFHYLIHEFIKVVFLLIVSSINWIDLMIWNLLFLLQRTKSLLLQCHGLNFEERITNNKSFLLYQLCATTPTRTLEFRCLLYFGNVYLHCYLLCWLHCILEAILIYFICIGILQLYILKAMGKRERWDNVW